MRSFRAIRSRSEQAGVFLFGTLLLVANGALAAAPASGAPASGAPAAGPASAPAGDDAKRDGFRVDDPPNSCLTCHSSLPEARLRDPALAHSASVHRDPRIGCVACHGGDPRDPTVRAHDPTSKFRAKPAGAELAATCGGCHGDPAFMRTITARLPVDQAVLYALSVHGKLVAAGHEAAPTCATCHGVHDIHPARSADSPTGPLNVHKLCGSCHADEKKMAPYERSTDQLARWMRSVHGERFTAGDESAPTCTGCHGPHAGALPGVSSVSSACGRCHVDEREAFLRSPHSKAFRLRGLADCVSCHGNHDVAPSSVLLVGLGPASACGKCHDGKDRGSEVVGVIAERLGGARARAEGVRAELLRAESLGLVVEGAAWARDRLDTEELRLRGLVHAVDPRALDDSVTAVDGLASEVHDRVEAAFAARRSERRSYVLVLVPLVLLFGLLVVRAVQLDRRRRSAA